jgi:hypothetical protein
MKISYLHSSQTPHFYLSAKNEPSRGVSAIFSVASKRGVGEYDCEEKTRIEIFVKLSEIATLPLA